MNTRNSLRSAARFLSATLLVGLLALTAFARGDDRRRALVAGFNMHVAKPVEPAELVAVVGSLAGRL